MTPWYARLVRDLSVIALVVAGFAFLIYAVLIGPQS